MLIMLIGFLGVAMRLAMLLSEKSFWGDEWFTLSLVTGSAREVLWGAIQDVHPPLYFLTLHGVVSLLGQEEWVFRSVSFLSSIGTLALIYFLALELFDRKTALTALLLSAISPFWLQSSNEVRSYSLLAFLSALAAYLLVRYLKNLGRESGRAAPFFLAMLAAVYVEHYAWFLAFAVFATVTSVLLVERRLKKLAIVLGLFLAAALPSLVLIGYQAIFNESVFLAGRMKEYFAISVMAKKIVGVFWHFTCGYAYSMLTVDRVMAYMKTSPYFWMSALSTISAIWFVARGLRAIAPRKEVFIFCAVTLLFPIFFLAIFYPIRLDARYVCFAAPVFFVLLAAGLSSVKNKVVYAALLGLLLTTSSVGSARAITATTDSIHREDYRSLLRYVTERAGPRDAVVGLETQMRFYRQKLNLNLRSDYYADENSFAKNKRREYEKVWSLNMTNMHPSVSERSYNEQRALMGRIGYEPDGKPIRFGGEEALTVLYLFRKGG